MRIFSGLYKGTNIQTSSRLAYRPTKAIVRKSIYDRFNKIGCGIKMTYDVTRNIL